MKWIFLTLLFLGVNIWALSHCENGVCSIDNTKILDEENEHNNVENHKDHKCLWDIVAEGKFDEALKKLKDYPHIDSERTKIALKNKWPIVKIITNKGDIVLGLFEDDAPNTVANFIYLASHKFYDNLIFHRVVKDFVIQGGDPTGTGRGGPGYKFENEICKYKHEKGVISMANAGPNTNGSQFFITLNKFSHLDGKYNVFGWVLKGQDVVENIKQGDKIKKIVVLYKRNHKYIPKVLSGKLPY